MTRIVFLFALGALLSATAGAAEEKWEITSKLKPTAIFSATDSFAETHKIPTKEIAPNIDGDQFAPGDSITALINLHRKGAGTLQWLLYLTAVQPGPKDEPKKKPEPAVLYTCLGNKFEFVSSPVPAVVQTLGPFGEAGDKHKVKTEAKQARFSLDKGFLGLGLDRAVATIVRLKEITNRIPFGFGDKPFPEAVVNKNREDSALARITTEEERALCGAGPALLTYFNVVEETPGLQDMLLKVIEMPSMWSMVRHVGVNPDLRFQTKQMRVADPAAWECNSNSPAYYFPMLLTLNDQPALRVTFVVTSPKSPLLGCGGIVGMLAEKPNESETYLTLRVISARCKSGQLK
ncbi:MAG TPA: hypothetical protein VLT36_13475 [Candidatus Dormibacteraeota bacterium]|nr:hypothetical protein [Candidatus Dormibacteraeota bacterium]